MAAGMICPRRNSISSGTSTLLLTVRLMNNSAGRRCRHIEMHRFFGPATARLDLLGMSLSAARSRTAHLAAAGWRRRCNVRGSSHRDDPTKRAALFADIAEVVRPDHL